MNKKIIPLFLLAGTTLLTACNEKKIDNTPVVSKEDAIAEVNGKYISKESLTTLENEISQRNQGQSLPKDKLVEELIQRELLVQDATQKKLDETEDFMKQLATVKSSLLTQAAVQNFLKSSPVTDTELKAEYDKNIAATGQEYKARHILVKSEDAAKKIIKELSAGADFVELAKTKSTGPSGPQGGDLGWFASGQMVAPFSEAVIALEDNKFTLEPVKTQFGYHIILREGSRAQTPPPFESVKEKIRPMMQRKKLQDFMEGLRNQATVEILLPAPAAAIPASDSMTNAVNKAQSAAKDSNSAEQAKATAAENAKNKISESAKKAADNAKSTASEAVNKTNEAVTEKVNKTLDSLTQ